MSLSNNPIGIFDSGLGGISVLQEIQNVLPNESIIFYGDSFNCPYGSKSQAEIISLSERIVDFLIEQKCKIIVVACNTATGAAIKHLRNKYEIPFVGIEPAVKPAAIQSKSKVIGVLATEGTFNGNHYKNTSGKYNDEVRIITKVGHQLVDIVEEQKIFEEDTEQILYSYLQPMIEENVDHIVLGCTHYPFLIPVIQKIIPKNIKIIDPAIAVAKRVSSLLNEKNLININSKISYHFYSSGDTNVLKNFTLSQLKCKSILCEFHSNNK